MVTVFCFIYVEGEKKDYSIYELVQMRAVESSELVPKSEV